MGSGLGLAWVWALVLVGGSCVQVIVSHGPGAHSLFPPTPLDGLGEQWKKVKSEYRGLGDRCLGPTTQGFMGIWG